MCVRVCVCVRLCVRLSTRTLSMEALTKSVKLDIRSSTISKMQILQNHKF